MRNSLKILAEVHDHKRFPKMLQRYIIESRKYLHHINIKETILMMTTFCSNEDFFFLIGNDQRGVGNIAHLSKLS